MSDYRGMLGIGLERLGLRPQGVENTQLEEELSKTVVQITNKGQLLEIQT